VTKGDGSTEVSPLPPVTPRPRCRRDPPTTGAVGAGAVSDPLSRAPC
jgi:hypothetical protein